MKFSGQSQTFQIESTVQKTILIILYMAKITKKLSPAADPEKK